MSMVEKTKVQLFAEQGAAQRAQLTEDERQAEGSKSATLFFEKCIGGKAQKRRVGTKEDGTGDYAPCLRPIGYAFHCSEDVAVPVAPLTTPGDEVTVDITGATQVIPANTSFVLNLTETAMFLSRTEYAGMASGDTEFIVYLSASQSGDDEQPRPRLNKYGDGSIKERLEASSTSTMNAQGKKSYTVKPEYAEKFAKYYESKVVIDGRTAGKTTSAAGENIKNMAAAFRSMYGM